MNMGNKVKASAKVALPPATMQSHAIPPIGKTVKSAA